MTSRNTPDNKSMESLFESLNSRSDNCQGKEKSKLQIQESPISTSKVI